MRNQILDWPNSGLVHKYHESRKQHVFVENDVIIGNNVTVKSGVQLWDGLRVKDNVFIGANVSFINDLIPRSKVYPSEFLMTTLEEHCSIGANSTIMGGLIIGEYALVAKKKM